MRHPGGVSLPGVPARNSIVFSSPVVSTPPGGRPFRRTGPRFPNRPGGVSLPGVPARNSIMFSSPVVSTPPGGRPFRRTGPRFQHRSSGLPLPGAPPLGGEAFGQMGFEPTRRHIQVKKAKLIPLDAGNHRHLRGIFCFCGTAADHSPVSCMTFRYSSGERPVLFLKRAANLPPW